MKNILNIAKNEKIKAIRKKNKKKFIFSSQKNQKKFTCETLSLIFFEKSLAFVKTLWYNGCIKNIERKKIIWKKWLKNS